MNPNQTTITTFAALEENRLWQNKQQIQSSASTPSYITPLCNHRVSVSKIQYRVVQRRFITKASFDGNTVSANIKRTKTSARRPRKANKQHKSTTRVGLKQNPMHQRTLLEISSMIKVFLAIKIRYNTLLQASRQLQRVTKKSINTMNKVQESISRLINNVFVHKRFPMKSRKPNE